MLLWYPDLGDPRDRREKNFIFLRVRTRLDESAPPPSDPNHRIQGRQLRMPHQPRLAMETQFLETANRL